MSSIVLPSRGQCIQVTDNLQLSVPIVRVDARSGRPSFIVAWHTPVLMFYQLICGRCGHGIHAHRDYVSMFVHHCPAMNCACILSEGRYSPVVVSVIMFMHLITDAPGTSMHMLGVSHRAYTSGEYVSFAYASALRRGCPPFPCQRIHRRRDQYPVHSGTHARSIH